VTAQDADRSQTAAAGDLGMRVAVKSMPYGATRTLDEAVALFAAAGNTGLAVDMFHLFRPGRSARSLIALDPRPWSRCRCSMQTGRPPPHQAEGGGP